MKVVGASLPSNAPEKDVYAVHVAGVEPDGMAGLGVNILEGEEVIGHLRGTGHLTGSLQAQHKKIQHQATVLDNEGGKLETTNDPIGVSMVHILRGRDKRERDERERDERERDER